MKDKFNKNIKMLAVFFTVCFLSIIVYLTYFDLVLGQKIAEDPTNKRIQASENEVLRGSILDRNGDVLVYSKRDKNGNQLRLYSDGIKYAHILGYNSKQYGKTGVERGYNDFLQGKESLYNIVATVFKYVKETINGDEKKGNDIYLTIDSKLQNIAYQQLGENKGAVVALDPNTGEVLALVSKPSFDPSNIDKNFTQYNSDIKNTPLINRATRGYYPPGSTFKIVTAASALENINGIENSNFFCDGKLKIGSYILRDHNGTAHGKESIKRAFEVSCNNTFGKIGMELGYNNLKSTAEDFMFNKEIGSNDQIDVLGIRSGSIGIEAADNKAQLAQDAIGQNQVAANPMDMALVSAAIGNGGNIMKPYVIKEIKDRYGLKLWQTTPSLLTKAVNQKVAAKLKDYMIGVVKEGTGRNARIFNLTIAGKTGTAEDGNKTHSWFTAFAPAEAPKIAIAVIVENGGQGGYKAASIAREVIKTYLKK